VPLPCRCGAPAEREREEGGWVRRRRNGMAVQATLRALAFKEAGQRRARDRENLLTVRTAAHRAGASYAAVMWIPLSWRPTSQRRAAWALACGKLFSHCSSRPAMHLASSKQSHTSCTVDDRSDGRISFSSHPTALTAPSCGVSCMHPSTLPLPSVKALQLFLSH
jgi:hypothetical protein